MPKKGAEYALLQKMYQRGNLIQEVASHRSRAREREKYYLAPHRNSFEQQRGNLRHGLEKLAPSVQAHYLGRIVQLDTQIADSEKKYPMFRAN